MSIGERGASHPGVGGGTSRPTHHVALSGLRRGCRYGFCGLGLRLLELLGEVFLTQAAPSLGFATVFRVADLVTRLGHLSFTPLSVVPSAVSLCLNLLLTPAGLTRSFVCHHCPSLVTRSWEGSSRDQYCGFSPKIQVWTAGSSDRRPPDRRACLHATSAEFALRLVAQPQRVAPGHRR